MSSMSRASSDPPVDLEKGAAGLKAAAIEEEELAAVDLCVATCIKATLDVFVAVYSLFCVGVTVWMVKVSDNWWDPWPAVLALSIILLWTIWVTPKIKEGCVRKYAAKRTCASDSDVTTKLLASKK